MMMTTDSVDMLHVSTVDAKPVEIDWNPDSDGEYHEPRPFWQAFEYDDTGETWQLIASGGSVVAVVIDGHPFTDYSDYADLVEEPALTEDQWDDLMAAEPYMSGAEGPMMNYYYPLSESEGPWSRSFDPVAAAVSVAGEPVCVVEIDGEYALALTGGGMDLSWEIAAAYVALGKLPPVHFRDLPAYADQWTDRHETVYRAMLRSLAVAAGWMTAGADRLTETRDRMRNR